MTNRWLGVLCYLTFAPLLVVGIYAVILPHGVVRWSDDFWLHVGRVVAIVLTAGAVTAWRRGSRAQRA
jgi:hypothetical protein